MDIYARLEEDHQFQRTLFERIEETQGDSEKRNELWLEIKTELEAHASAEEQTFYAELMSYPDGSDKARHGVAEHQEAANLIEELDGMDMSSPAWLRKLKHLKDCTAHHLDEEEKEVFPAAKQLISTNRAEKLAEEFNKRKPAEKRKEEASQRQD